MPNSYSDYDLSSNFIYIKGDTFVISPDEINSEMEHRGFSFDSIRRLLNKNKIKEKRFVTRNRITQEMKDTFINLKMVENRIGKRSRS